MRKNKLTKYLRFIAILSLLPIVLINLKDITQNVAVAVSVCINIIIPTLYPLLLLTQLLSSIDIPSEIKKYSGIITRKIFGLSGECIIGIITGLFCGYNCAIISSNKLYEDRKISIDEAQRLALFFTSPGFSFCVLIAGVMYYNSFTIGLLMLISNISASMMTASICNLVFRKKPKNKKTTGTNRTVSIINIINSTTESALSICSWILFFYCINALVRKFPFPEKLMYIPEIFSEVTSGLEYCKQFKNIFYSSFCVSFGGICIFVQQLPLIKKLQIKPAVMLLIRIITSVLSNITFYIFLHLFNINIQTSSMFLSKRIFYNSGTGAFSLILLCFVLICYINSERKANFKIQ